jgi:tRNA nucleotidyltransferase/poly(A) polymerase
MKLIEVLELIDFTAQEKGLSKPFICGGLPRDKIIYKSMDLSDVDITNGDATIHLLAKEVYLKLKQFGATYVVKSDGHATIMIGLVKLDFSSNFILPNLELMFNQKMSPLRQELISRDFTCNTMLMSMDLKKVYDPLGVAVDAIMRKEIDTNLGPEITLRASPNRAVRVIYLSSKLNFKLSERLENWIINNKDIFLQIKPKYIVEKINKGMSYNSENTINLIKKLQIENYIPLNYQNFKGIL